MSIKSDFVQQKEEKEDPKKRGASPKGSAKSKGSGKEADQEPTTEGEPVPDEKYWPVGIPDSNRTSHVMRKPILFALSLPHYNLCYMPLPLFQK